MTCVGTRGSAFSKGGERQDTQPHRYSDTQTLRHTQMHRDRKRERQPLRPRRFSTALVTVADRPAGIGRPFSSRPFPVTGLSPACPVGAIRPAKGPGRPRPGPCQSSAPQRRAIPWPGERVGLAARPRASGRDGSARFGTVRGPARQRGPSRPAETGTARPGRQAVVDAVGVL